MKLFPEGTFSGYKKEYADYYSAYFTNEKNFNRVACFLDFLWCYVRYGCWINNYFEYRFWEKSHKKRNTFLTWKRARKFINSVNGKGHNPTFRNKHMFLEQFSNYISREWLYLPNATFEEFKEFVFHNNLIMEKKDNGMFGLGVSKKKVAEIQDLEKYYQEGVSKNILLEECIEACEEIKSIHPNSLNTIRIMTLVDKKHEAVSVIGAVLRMGNNGAVVDNARADGLFAEIDIETGIVKTGAVNFEGAHYLKHPCTDRIIIGMQIPKWDEIINLCKKMAMEDKSTKLVGWDIAICSNKVGDYIIEVIEGNDRPGVPTMQVAGQCGIYDKVKAYEK